MQLIWGDDDHKWVKAGQLFTRGPGTYKIPSFNDVPSDFRVKLMKNVNNPFAVHSSKVCQPTHVNQHMSTNTSQPTHVNYAALKCARVCLL